MGGRWLSSVLAENHPALFSLVAADPSERLADYGVLGIFALLAIYAIKKMYDAITKSFNDRLADKDAIIENRDATIAKQDTIISMFMQQGQQAVPALQRTAQVIEALPKTIPAAAPVADLEEVKQVLPRLLEVLERLETPPGDGQVQ